SGEVDLVNKIWRLPRERTKNDEDVALPLGPMAWAIIEAQPRIADVDYVWGARRTGFSHMKTMLDAAMKIAPWRNHDLRRTGRTLLARAGVIEAVAERCIGHKVGSAVSQIYNQHQYIEEMRRAFAALEHLIEAIINPPPANVADLQREKRRWRRWPWPASRAARTSSIRRPANFVRSSYTTLDSRLGSTMRSDGSWAIPSTSRKKNTNGRKYFGSSFRHARRTKEKTRSVREAASTKLRWLKSQKVLGCRLQI